MDISEQRLYQLIENNIQFGETLYEIQQKLEEYQNEKQEDSGEGICYNTYQCIQDQKRMRDNNTKHLYDCVMEMKEHKKVKSFLKSESCFYCGLRYVILRNHYANPKSACSAKYRQDNPDTPQRPYTEDEETEPSQDSLKSVCANLENLHIESTQSSLEPSQEFDIERNNISAHLAQLNQEQIHIVTPESSQEEDSDATQDICENLIDCSTQQSSQDEPVITTEPVVCSHFFDCGCNKEICEECLEKEENESGSNDGLDCGDECKNYYKYRNDNCNCDGPDCGYCFFIRRRR